MSLVINTIEAFPRGRTTQELFALLDVNFDHAVRLRIQSELSTLQKEGVITLGRDRKWRVIARRSVASKPVDRPSIGSLSQPDNEIMLACAGRFSTEPLSIIPEPENADGGGRYAQCRCSWLITCSTPVQSS